MSLKENFNQAMKELLKKDNLVGDDLSRGSKKKTEVDRYMENAVPKESRESLAPAAETPSAPEGYGTSFSEQPAVPTTEDFLNAVHNRNSPDPFANFGDTAEIPITEPEPTAESVSHEKFEYTASTDKSYTPPPQPRYTAPEQSQPRYQSGGYGGYGGYNPPRTPAASASYRGGRPPETPYYETEETTVISRNTRINGDISSFANVNVDGSVQGDIKLTKNIAVSGKVVGNIECNNAVMTGAEMQGSISSKGQVQIDHDSVLLGDVDTQYLDLNGRIKGNVDVGGKAEFKSDAVIVGNITASTISVIDGAVIKGFVNTTFMQESTANVFPEAISVGE